MPHATSPSPGLQAIILCGPGASLNTFTSNPKDFPKALVPIANRPMVWYALDWCYRMGVNAITLITPPESEPAIQSALKTHPALTSLPSPKPEILAPADLQQTTGTGQILRLPEVQKCIHTDFIIVPCDLITELDGSKLIQQWMTLNPIPALNGTRQKNGLSLFYPTQGLEGISHKKDETDFIATVSLPQPPVPPPFGSLRSNVERLVIAMPTDTLNDRLEEDKEVFKLRAQLPRKYGRVKLHTKYRDSHIYIFPKWVKDFAAQNPRFESISEDIVGWWAKADWQNGLAEKLGMHEVLAKKRRAPRAMEESMVEEEDDVVDASALSSTQVSRPTARARGSSREFASRVGTTTGALSPSPEVAVPSVFAYVQPPHPTAAPTPDSPFIRRVDTSAAILNVSLYLAKQPLTHVLSPDAKVHATASIGAQSRIALEDSLVAENVKIGIRNVIKETIIGANCEIGDNVRLTRCLLMDGVRIGDGVQLAGCIIGRRAKLEGLPKPPAESSSSAAAALTEGEADKGKGRKKASSAGDDDARTRLTECEVAPGFVVEAGTEAKGEKMMPFDTDDLMDVEAAEVDDDEEDDEDEE